MPTSASLPTGTPVRYRPTGQYFTGGQGNVIVCQDTQLDRQVAIKVRHIGGEPEVLATELAALSAIQSKHVVQVFDLIVDRGQDVVGIVQEFLEGDDLKAYSGLEAGQGDYLKVLYQAACGIADIHEAGRIHRDIKPDNMRFDGENILRIFDFGLACDRRGSTLTGQARGTDGFRAPELYALPARFTAAVDVYAFGVLAWHLAGDGLPSALLEFPPLRSGSVEPLGEHALNLPPDVTLIVDRCLERDPEARPPMNEVCAALKRRLLYGQHRAFVGGDTAPKEISGTGSRSKATLSHGQHSAQIHYNGLGFLIVEIKGEVSVNGVPADEGMVLPDSCVLIFGGKRMESSRLFVAFNSSHPEVVL